MIVQERRKKKIKTGESQGAVLTDRRQGVRRVGCRLVVMRGVELGRRAAAWRPREVSQGGVHGLGTAEAEESRGVSGTWKTGAWEDTGDPGRHTGSSGAGRELESPGRTEEETRELENAKGGKKMNRRFNVQSTVNVFFVKLSVITALELRMFLPRNAGLSWLL